MKTLIAIPCMDMIHTEFARALLSLGGEGDVQITFAQSSLIYDARNQLAEIAVRDGFDRVLWLDSDMTFPPETFRRLHTLLDAGRTVAAGLYFGRKPPFRPIIYKSVRLENRGGKWATPIAEHFDDFPRDAVFPVRACGFGCVMTDAALLGRIYDRFGLPFSPLSGLGEDLSFCARCGELGETIWCDSGLRCGHVGIMTYTEESFRAAARPAENPDKEG